MRRGRRTDAGRAAGSCAFAADFRGDERDEVILFGSRGAGIGASARPDPDPALHHETQCPGR